MSLRRMITYSITFQVKPTEEAKQDYQTDNGYYRDPNGNLQQEVFTGAEGTDAPGNTTSSGQPGFHRMRRQCFPGSMMERLEK